MSIVDPLISVDPGLSMMNHLNEIGCSFTLVSVFRYADSEYPEKSGMYGTSSASLFWSFVNRSARTAASGVDCSSVTHWSTLAFV